MLDTRPGAVKPINAFDTLRYALPFMSVKFSVPPFKWDCRLSLRHSRVHAPLVHFSTRSSRKLIGNNKARQRGGLTLRWIDVRWLIPFRLDSGILGHRTGRDRRPEPDPVLGQATVGRPDDGSCPR